MSNMTDKEKITKIVDHVWSVYMPIVIAALKDKYPEGREIIASLTKEELRRFWEEVIRAYKHRINSVDFFHWFGNSRPAEFDSDLAARHVDKYIEQWFGCDYKELMLPKDI